MAPVCSNCSGTDFVWANELKTGMTGASLSLRTRGEVPLGTRICRTCGHADLFLRDISILHQPHNWRPGEFVPIAPKPSAPKPASAPPSPPAPEAAPAIAPPAPPPPPGHSAPSASVEPVVEPDPVSAPAPEAPVEATPTSGGADDPPAKPKSPRRRSSKPKPA